jgi:hypothetical protein
LPDYATIGLAAPVTLTLLRMVQGLGIHVLDGVFDRARAACSAAFGQAMDFPSSTPVADCYCNYKYVNM